MHRSVVKHFLLLCLVLTICSCSKVDKSTIDISRGIEVEIDSVASGCVLLPVSMRIIDDMLVLGNNKRDTICDIFSLPDLGHIGSGLVKGNAPDAVLSPIVHTMTAYPGGNVCMLTGHPGVVAVVSIPTFSVIQRRPIMTPPEWPFPGAVEPVGYESVFTHNADLPCDWALLDKDGNSLAAMPCNVPPEIDRDIPDEDIEKRLIRSSIGLVSPDHTRFAVILKCMPVISLYKKDGSLVNLIEVPHTYKGPYGWVLSAISTNDCIYVNFRSPEDNAAGRVAVAAIDWEGNLIKVYKVAKPVGAFCVDEKRAKIYFTTVNDDDNIYSFRL